MRSQASMRSHDERTAGTGKLMAPTIPHPTDNGLAGAAGRSFGNLSRARHGHWGAVRDGGFGRLMEDQAQHARDHAGFVAGRPPRAQHS
ncbi:hypothetical protein [Streptomyces yangpuensis]